MKNDPGYELKKNLKKILKKADISQREIARKFGVSDSTLSQLFNRKSGTELKYLCGMANMAGKKLVLVSLEEKLPIVELNTYGDIKDEDLTMKEMFMILTKELVKIENKLETCIKEINELKKALGHATIQMQSNQT